MSIVIDDTDLPKVGSAWALSPLPESVILIPGALVYPFPPLVRGIAVTTPAEIVGVPTTAVWPLKNCCKVPVDVSDIAVPLLALVKFNASFIVLSSTRIAK